jgi:hypothetical protein
MDWVMLVCGMRVLPPLGGEGMSVSARKMLTAAGRRGSTGARERRPATYASTRGRR